MRLKLGTSSDRYWLSGAGVRAGRWLPVCHSCPAPGNPLHVPRTPQAAGAAFGGSQGCGVPDLWESCDKSLSFSATALTMTRWVIALGRRQRSRLPVTIGVSGLPYADSGASAFERSGRHAVPTAVAYHRCWGRNAASPWMKLRRTCFTVSIGANLFPRKIAKIRRLQSELSGHHRQLACRKAVRRPCPHLLLDLSKVDPSSTPLRASPPAGILLRHQGRRGQCSCLDAPCAC